MRMLDDFYFNYIELENYDAIVSETRKYILKEVEKINKPGFALLDSNQDFIDNCPLFYDWVKSQNLEISCVAVHILEPNTIGFLHQDGYNEKSYLAVNMDMSNCAGTQTRFFKVSVPGKEYKTLNGSLSYVVYEFNDTCTEVCHYDLAKPVVFNISKPHRVYNEKDTKRVSLSVRFMSNPFNLLT